MPCRITMRIESSPRTLTLAIHAGSKGKMLAAIAVQGQPYLRIDFFFGRCAACQDPVILGTPRFPFSLR